MKKLLLLSLLLFLIIPSSVQASGVLDIVSLVVPTIKENKKVIGQSENTDKSKKKLPCGFGFKFNYQSHTCEKVVVPEHGILNEDGISVRCEVGYKLLMRSRNEFGMTYECNKIIIPAHAQLSGTGDDFQCDRDYRRVGDECVRLLLPPNSHIAAGGNDFDCNTGHTKVDGRCDLASKPVNAKFFPNSDQWYCENGYKRVDDRCEALIVPVNARAYETGTFFYCLQGYRLAENGRDCERVSYPENAEPNWLGEWDCNQGYRKDNDRCVKEDLPNNAKWVSRGSDFYCEPTFRKDEVNRVCVKIDLPQNAEYDSASYGGWRCKQGFIKNLGSNSCDPFKLPDHAFWIGFNSWDCDPGFRKNLQRLRCDKVSIPDHAHPANNYDRWDCNNGYKKNYDKNTCELI